MTSDPETTAATRYGSRRADRIVRWMFARFRVVRVERVHQVVERNVVKADQIHHELKDDLITARQDCTRSGGGLPADPGA